MSSPLTQSIVLVDDEKSYTDLMVAMLAENIACPVHGFTRPLAALEALPAIRPGVVVTDYSMPEITGIDFIRRATPLLPGAVFVMITGNNLSAQQAELDRLSALKGFLPKPFGWRVLANEVMRVWPPGIAAPLYRADTTSI